MDVPVPVDSSPAILGHWNGLEILWDFPEILLSHPGPLDRDKVPHLLAVPWFSSLFRSVYLHGIPSKFRKRVWRVYFSDDLKADLSLCCCFTDNCQEAVCTLQQWTAWADMAQPVSGHCASQSRRRVYTKTWRQVVDPNGCHNAAQTCPSDIVDTREKGRLAEYLHFIVLLRYYYMMWCVTSSAMWVLLFCANTIERMSTESSFWLSDAWGPQRTSTPPPLHL